MDHFLDAFRNYATFQGRATRTQYWMFFLIYLLIYIALSVIDGLFGVPVLSTIFALVMLIPSIAYATRRLHDTGRTGWWQLIALIPLIGAIVLIVFLAMPSTSDEKYGVPVAA
ncbi:Uncharacterized membrane protein YhaH, DUF805 family [Marinobacter persicus]|uniref:Uncharacterized membrane protein YhaH, DUF805 family n=1 Tax=Marinobacter persicus TaxID=930118 RepID=A0A1I3VRQ0_9GAMM|nr:DUF805 domain-containing protein [Marinobacter persicus]GHD50500.1 DUF805 domain-containing protein [Marinobacter persicus]SFJ96957.1 Uncharacterized membrane protein YhaH, DUF805 family [Marinobacter persicus]